MEDEDSEDSGSGVPAMDQVKSYLAYGKRALRSHRRGALGTAAVGLALTVAAVAVWPRAYASSITLAVKENKILDGDRDPGSLRNATEIIVSRENMAEVVKELDMPKRWEQNLSPLGRFKRWLSDNVRGVPSERDKRDILISMVQASVWVQPPAWNESKFTVHAEWPDPKSARDIADAALKGYLRARRVAEISTITEYISILEGHTNQLRDEIQKYATQSKSQREQQFAQLNQATTREAPSAPGSAPAPARVAAPPPRRPQDLSELRATIAEKQAALKAVQETRQRRMSDAEQTLSGLRTKFTPAHPMVVAAESALLQISADVRQSDALKAEVDALNQELRSKVAADELEAQGGPRVGRIPSSSGTPGAPGVEPLPADIMRLMQEGNEDLDPAVSAQFRGAVGKYATLRDRIGTAKVDLDTAEAAFKHRYQIVAPAEMPSKPFKPKVPLLLAGGILASLVLGLVVALLAELRKGRVVERWQVYRLGVPLLAELNWPPKSDS
jgi:uncharacterized protein involved in exopolysaccharide biosynthesis